MKRILATTALVMIMAGSAYSAEMGNYSAQPQDVEASDFIGARIYAAENMPTTDSVKAGAEKDWDDVGEINDVILGRDGQIKAVVLGVGGFLGMGEKSVAVPMQDVKFVKNGEGPNDYFLVVNANKDVLTNAPAYVSLEEKAAQQAAANDAAAPADSTLTTPADTAADTTTTQPADTTTAADTTASTATTTEEKPADTASSTTATEQKPADTTTAMTDTTTAAPADDTANTDATTTASTTNDNATQAMTDENRTRLTRPEITKDGYKLAEAAELTADKLEGARVYGPKDEDVGEVNRIILDNNGQVQRIVLDVGGFLGVGERQIAVTPDELNIVRTDDGSEFRVYIDADQATLKAQPEYKG